MIKSSSELENSPQYGEALSHAVPTQHMWLKSPKNIASMTEVPNFVFYSILANLNLRWLVATICESVLHTHRHFYYPHCRYE